MVSLPGHKAAEPRALYLLAGICFVVAWLTNAAGLSYSLGAFVAGLIISQSEFSLDAVSNIIPFRDVFSAIFFISIGMLLDPSVIFTCYDIIFTLITIILVVKVVTGTFAATILGLPVRVAVFTGLALAQIGEFSFVLAKSGLGTILLDNSPYQTFLASAIITMALTPFTMNAAPLLTGLLHRLFPDRVALEGEAECTEHEFPDNLHDHIIIVGYGLTGRSVARATEIAGIPFIAIDLDPDVIRRERETDASCHILYGDATHEEILLHAGIGRSRALVVTIPEQNIVPGIVHMAREAAPEYYIIARTRQVSEVKHLMELGADEVIPEVFETSVQAFIRVLAKYTLPGSDTVRLGDTIRNNASRLFTRNAAALPAAGTALCGAGGDLEIHTLRIPDGSRAVGRSLQELEAEGMQNVRILAIRRGASTVATLQPETMLEAGDCLILHATSQNLQNFRSLTTGN